MVWPTSEHVYQAMKSVDERIHRHVATMKSADRAKQFGSSVILRDDWEKVKIPIMKDILQAKFSVPEMKELLIATDDEILVEYTWWNDTFWGVNTDYQGENNLGKLLMEIRNEIIQTL